MSECIFSLKCLIFQDVGLVNKYVSKIQELEGELLHIKNLKKTSNHQYSDDSYDVGPRSNNVLFPSSNESSDCEDKVMDVTGWYLNCCFSICFCLPCRKKLEHLNI